MAEVLIGAAVSILTGVGLWAFLPRGVVLTRSARGQDGIQFVWELQNDSALPVRIRSVTVGGAITYNEETKHVTEIELAPESRSTPPSATRSSAASLTPPWVS